MFTPKYRIIITIKDFPEDKEICLGTQLVVIVNKIKEFLPQHFWYGANIEVTGNKASRFNGVRLNKIGTDAQLIQYSLGIVQFIWGEFICIDVACSTQNFDKIELEAEDPPFRSIDCYGVLLEIRTFDTNCFEIYSESLELMRQLSKIYNVEIEQNN